MTKSPGGKRFMKQDKEQPAQLSHPVIIIIDCNLSNLRIAIYIDSVPALHMCSQTSLVKSGPPCYYKDELYYILQYSLQAQPYRE